MRIPKSLTNRRDYLISKITPLQEELAQVEKAISVLSGDDHAGNVNEIIAAENKAAAVSSLAGTKADDREPPAMLKRKESA